MHAVHNKFELRVDRRGHMNKNQLCNASMCHTLWHNSAPVPSLPSCDNAAITHNTHTTRNREMPTETLPCHAIWPFVSNGYAISRAHNTKRRHRQWHWPLLCMGALISWWGKRGKQSEQYFDIDIGVGVESNRDGARDAHGSCL